MPHCPTCRVETAEGQTRCPECGSLLAAPPEGRTAPTDRGRDVGAGFVTGLAALAVGFLVTLSLSDADENREVVEDIVGSDGVAGAVLSELLPEWYHVASWLFLDAHQVDVSVSVGSPLGDAAWVGEYVETVLPAASELQLLPPLLLVCAGILVTLRRSRTGAVDAALAGATVAIGYLPGIIAVAAVSTFEVTVFGDVALLEIGPAFGQAVLLAGLVYPLAFGVAGGILAFVLGRVLST